jgi:hypothetical protein
MKTYKTALLAAISACTLSVLTTACDRPGSDTESGTNSGYGTVEPRPVPTNSIPGAVTNRLGGDTNTMPR